MRQSKWIMVVPVALALAGCSSTASPRPSPSAPAVATPLFLAPAVWCRRAIPDMVTEQDQLTLAMKHPDGSASKIADVNAIVNKLNADQQAEPPSFAGEFADVIAPITDWQNALTFGQNTDLPTGAYKTASIALIEQCGKYVP